MRGLLPEPGIGWAEGHPGAPENLYSILDFPTSIFFQWQKLCNNMFLWGRMQYFNRCWVFIFSEFLLGWSLGKKQCIEDIIMSHLDYMVLNVAYNIDTL